VFTYIAKSGGGTETGTINFSFDVTDPVTGNSTTFTDPSWNLTIN